MKKEEKQKLEKLTSILIDTAKRECAEEGFNVSPELEELAVRLIKSQVEAEEVSKFMGKIRELCKRFVEEDNLDI